MDGFAHSGDSLSPCGISHFRIFCATYLEKNAILMSKTARYRGFTLIELAIVIFVGGLILSGLLQLLQTTIANRQTQIQQEAVDTVKTNIALTAVNNKTVASACTGTGCGIMFILNCPLPLGSCPVVVSTYAIPASTAAIKDYWGNDLVYARIATSVTSTTTPATPVFTITSRGPDATTPSTDDIIYTVNAGEFVARISRMGF